MFKKSKFYPPLFLRCYTKSMSDRNTTSIYRQAKKQGQQQQKIGQSIMEDKLWQSRRRDYLKSF